jgi:hypothetical protein
MNKSRISYIVYGISQETPKHTILFTYSSLSIYDILYTKIMTEECRLEASVEPIDANKDMG